MEFATQVCWCHRLCHIFVIIALLPGIRLAQENRSEFSIARQICEDMSSQLPDLSSIRDGSLVDRLESNQSTWIDAWIERGPWVWHSSDQKIHSNQGCFTIHEYFEEHFVWSSSIMDLGGCLSTCHQNEFEFAGITTTSIIDPTCYCGNRIPFEAAVDDGKCAAECKSGESMCGSLGYARVITVGASMNDFNWENDHVGSSNKWCAALSFQNCRKYQWGKCSASLSPADCLKKKKALCATHNTTYVSHQPMTWFEAQTYCNDGDTVTSRLYRFAAVESARSGPAAEDINVKYWTQLSSFHLSSSNSYDTFSGIRWADGHPVLNNRTCIRAMKKDDAIELISSDCAAESPFICISGDELTSTSESPADAETGTTQNEDSTTSIIPTSNAFSATSMASDNLGFAAGSVVGAIMIVVVSITVALGIVWSVRKNKKKEKEKEKENAKLEAQQLPMLLVNNGDASEIEADAYCEPCEVLNEDRLSGGVEETVIVENDVYG